MNWVLKLKKFQCPFTFKKSPLGRRENIKGINITLLDGGYSTHSKD